MKHVLVSCVFTILGCFAVHQLSAQETVRERINRRQAAQQNENSVPQLSVRAEKMNETLTQDIGNARWMREIYRIVDLNKEKNAPLYYPVEPTDDRMNLFTMLFRLLSSESINAYEFLDGREVFADKYKIKFKEGLLDRFGILYHQENGRFVVDDSDVPSNEVTAYYVKEAWYFDSHNSVVDVKLLAICPVLYRQDDLGASSIPTPLFWVPYESIRPYAARMQIMTSSLNNASLGTVDDFFRRRLYDGEIYKTMNFKNQALVQLYPDEKVRKKEQAKIESQLNSFESNLWARCAECDSLVTDTKETKSKSVQKSSGNSQKKRTNESLSEKKANAKSSSGSSPAKTKAAPKRTMRDRRR